MHAAPCRLSAGVYSGKGEQEPRMALMQLCQQQHFGMEKVSSKYDLFFSSNDARGACHFIKGEKRYKQGEAKTAPPKHTPHTHLGFNDAGTTREKLERRPDQHPMLSIWGKPPNQEFMELRGTSHDTQTKHGPFCSIFSLIFQKLTDSPPMARLKKLWKILTNGQITEATEIIKFLI